MEKHVGKSEEFLARRLATEPDIRGASSFYDREVAEQSISDLLKANRSEIERWLRTDGKKVVLTGTASRALGSCLSRATEEITEGTGIRLVLRRDPGAHEGYRIQTAMVTE